MRNQSFNFCGCLHPRFVYNKYLGKSLLVPCGHCEACRSLAADNWRRRLELESTAHRYCMFGTLTFTDDKLPRKYVGDCVFSEKEKELVSQSSEFIKKNNYLIPYCDVSRFQKYIKKLRINLVRKFSIPQEKATVRYFCQFEYGPTTFRPHLHYLLWYDNPEVHAVLKECIYESWKSENSVEEISEFFKRNKHSLVRFGAEKYVAQYMLCNSKLPPVLFTKEFRAKHVQSINPSIGLLGLSEDQIQRFAFGMVGCLSYSTRSNSRIKSVQAWSSFKSRLFPRCIGFDRISLSDRVQLYTVASKFKEFGAFKEWVLLQWNTSLSFFLLLSKLLFHTLEDVSFNLSSESVTSSLRRIYYVSRRFVLLCGKYCLEPEEMVRRISDFYSHLDYENLKSQLRIQEIFSRNSTPNLSLSHYPAFIDPSFVFNGRGLKPDVYELYLKQFFIPLSNSTYHMVHKPRSLPYLMFSDFCKKVVFDNTKSRVKRDYVSSHPEFINLYRSTKIIL